MTESEELQELIEEYIKLIDIIKFQLKDRPHESTGAIPIEYDLKRMRKLRRIIEDGKYALKKDYTEIEDSLKLLRACRITIDIETPIISRYDAIYYGPAKQKTDKRHIFNNITKIIKKAIFRLKYRF